MAGRRAAVDNRIMLRASGADQLGAKSETADPIRIRYAWLGVLALALLIRIPLVLQPACIDRNGVQFVEYARRIDDGPVQAMRETRRQPGFAVLLLWTHRMAGGWLGGDSPESWQRCGELLALVGGVGVCVAIYVLTRRLFDERVALLAGALAVAWPQGAEMSAQVLSDMPHLAVYLLAMLLAYDALRSGRLLSLAAAGFVAGVAYLIRQEAIGLVAAAAICWVAWGKRSQPRRRWLGLVGLIGGFVVAAAPHSVITGQWMPNKNPADFLRMMNDSVSGALPGGLTLAYAAPRWKIPGRLVEEWAKSGRYVIATLFLIAMVLRSAPRAEPNGRRLVAMAAAIEAILLIGRSEGYGEYSARYVVILVALCVPWAAGGWLALMRRATRRIALGIVVLVPLCVMGAYLVRPVYAGKEQLRLAGQWLGGHAGAGERVLAHEQLEQIMFYAGRTYPDRTWVRCDRSDDAARLKAIISRKRPAWFVDAEDSHRGELDERAHFAGLADGSIPALRLELAVGREGRRAFVYRVE